MVQGYLPAAPKDVHSMVDHTRDAVHQLQAHPPDFIPFQVLQVASKFTQLLQTVQFEEQEQLIDQLFAPYPTFVDNLLYAQTRRGVQLLYWCFKLPFKHIEADLRSVRYSVELDEVAGTLRDLEIRLRYTVHGRHRYHNMLPFRLLLPDTLNIAAEVTLTMDKHLRITKQQDAWTNAPYWTIKLPMLLRRLYGSLVAFTLEMLQSNTPAEAKSVLERVKAEPHAAVY